MPKKSTKKENTVFVLYYYYDNDNVGSGIHGVYASLAAAKAALQRIIDGAPLLVEGNTVYDLMHRYDPDDPQDWEIELSGNKTYYLIESDSCSNYLSAIITEKTVKK